MAESQSSTSSSSSSSTPAKKSLAPAGTSTDPVVHQLVAEREIAVQNRDARKRDRDLADEQSGDDQKVIDEKTKQLNELGYE